MQPLRLVAQVSAISLPVTSHSQSCELLAPRAIYIRKHQVPERLSHGDAIGGCLKH